MFNIDFVKNELTELEKKENSRYGIIKIDDLNEKFLSSLSYWSVKDYRKQWLEGISRVVKKRKTSCLITCMYDPLKANFINLWTIYVEGENAVFQENIIFLTKLDKVYNILNPYEHLPKHETITDDGDLISEWTIPISELNNYLKI